MPDNVEPLEDDSSTGLQPSVDDSSSPPEIVPPKTKAPVQFNQQNNFYQQIPNTAWDRLSPDQVVELSKRILDHANELDKRDYDFAKDRIGREDQRGKRNLYLGSVIVVVAFSVAGYLSIHGHEFIASTISLPLVTLLAMLVGNKLKD